jgi:hypothetical protein
MQRLAQRAAWLDCNALPSKAEVRMTEDVARALLRAVDGVGGLEAWIAGQPWRKAPGGWQVEGNLGGTEFELKDGGAHLRVIAWVEGAGPAAEWTVECPEQLR